ncbi:hypothetical protein RD792_012814 [Penstemon davidsonii]|uniref:ABC transporter domain-containing protein n=1 Tax=Penstemon davidsonii TaxID=160366 RepID=A0ABR0CXY5_9LAMI|nr:hypothetical protein RD792_012814 [Penstemon davidsonii]
MNTGDVFNASNSLRRSAWRNNVVDIFSSSSREEDDEEALKWAALEKLPTFDRLRKGLLLGSRGATNEVNIQDLDFQERNKLFERLVRVAEEDHEKFLLKLKNRIDRVGIDLPTIEVRFENLKIETEVHQGSRALPSFSNFFINILEEFSSYLHIIHSRKKYVSILRGVSGILKPCRMTLLLGPPSSGKTTLLLSLAGKLDPALKVSGTITYNGHGMKEFEPQRTAAYVSQNDVHIGEMTVRETLAFSARCQGVGNRRDMLAELARREKEANIKPDSDVDIYMKAAAVEGQEANVVTDYILKILGLENCADTFVGDQMIRGISGGQKKRVTTGEMLVGPAKALFMDEISTGLDSSTTFQVVNSIRQSVHILKGTALIALLQPEPETYNLFDDIILISNGHIVYQGPRENVLDFFQFMGFKCPERKGVADFLQEVTSKKDQMQYWSEIDKPYRFITSNEFSEAFQSFKNGQKLRDELAIPFDKSKSHPAALATKEYSVSKKDLLKASISRELLLMRRNSFFYIFKLLQLTIMATIAMSLFFRTTMHRDNISDGRRFLGALFYFVMTTTFNGLGEIALTVQKLPVFYKQRNFSLYPAWAYAIPKIIMKLPINVVEIALFVSLTYYEIGLDPNVGRNIVNANTIAFFVLLLIFALSGYILSRENVKKWWIWFYWCSPMMYAEHAMFVNEFTGNNWRHVPPNTTESLGVQVLKSRGYFSEAYWYWIGLGALFGLFFLYNLGFILALTFLKPLGNHQAVLAEDNTRNENQNEVGELSPWNVAEKDDHQNKKKAIILPFEPHTITFEDVSYSVDMPQEMKYQGVSEDRLVLLKGVSGAFRPGVLTALMGVSGAGKTTLMDVLSGRKTGGYIEGNITISGYPKKQETFTRISGYCEQNDIHSPCVTVFESLVFSAWLRLPQEVDLETRKIFVENVMELVELTPLRGGLVGLPGVSGLSTEQRKRLTIAVELVSNPSIIFMDEPTSGLDARSAAIVMRTVRNTVDTGRTVVCTIHQPSIDIFEAFDELFLMKRGGQEIYVGPLGRHSCHLIQYFEGIRGVTKIKDGYNPATWMLEVTSSAQEMLLGFDFAEVYKNSELYRRNKALITELSTPNPGSSELYFPTEYSQSFFSQCMACLWKHHWSYWRNPPYTAVRMLYTIFLALVFGSMFWDLGSKLDTEQDIFNAMGSMYAATFFLGNQSASSVQPVVAVERAVFYRERAAGMYSAFSYAFGQVVIEIPYLFVQAVVYGTIVYAMIGFEWTATKYFWYIYFLFFTISYFTFYGMMVVFVSPNLNISNTISYAFYSLWNLFSGFVIPRPMTPVWWRWYHWACPVAWTLYGLVASQFGDVKDQLDSKQSVEDFSLVYQFSILAKHYNFEYYSFSTYPISSVINQMNQSGSLRENSSSFWRYNSLQSTRQEEDDEEALKWAALERLPTYDRLTKGLLLGSNGGTNEIDIRNLGFQERKDLLERLLKVADADNEKFLLKLRERIDRVGIDLPTIEVRFEHVNVGAEAYIGSRALPTFLNFIINILEGFLSYLHILPSKKKHVEILQDISGIIKPCRMTLLLGPPSSGKTTLLLALAGKLDPCLKFSGNVTYNGHGMNEFVAQNTAAYISQHDVHIGEMTVRETLEFSARCQGIGSRYEMLSELSRREKHANIKPDPDIDVFMKAVATEGQEASVITDYVLKVLGLDVCADTMVGDELTRGISGGQKKRVTTGEMLVGPTNALFMDEISTGLDTSTTFQIVNSLRQFVHILNGTALISLLQPAPETYQLFDDVILLSDGKIVYQGPRENVLEFFEYMGFKCPQRKGVADFLQEVTSKKDQEQYWVRIEEPYRFVTVNEFVEAFKSFHVGKRLKESLEIPYDKSRSHPAALTTRKYGVNTKDLLKACFSRELMLMKRNSFVYFFKISQIIIMGFVTMTLFLRTNMHRRNIEDGFIYVGALFFTTTIIMFNGMAEVSMTIFKLPVFYKQRDSLFFPPWIYAIPAWILKVPVSFVEVAVWVFLTYYVIGFDPDVGRLFKQYVLLLFLNQMASGLFRLIGAMGRSMIIANTFGSLALLILFAMSGVVLSRDKVKKFWIWMYWSSPLMYAQNAVVVNEFRGNSWNNVVANTTESLGVAVLKARGFLPDAKMYWIGVVALCGFTLLFNIGVMIALTFLNPFGKGQAIIPEESESNESNSDIEVSSITGANRNRKKGMVLPFEPHSITFDEIVYSVDMPQEMKEKGVVEDKLVLLKNVSGAFRPGVLTALMGVSGAGKTTLMDVLAGRKTGGYIDGNIKISGYPKKQETFARISGYCEQNDIHSPHVTVYESLLYSAWLRLPHEVDVQTRKMFIEEVMELVELTPLRGALVGLPGVSGLSIEQRKRLTIAVELVANPSIIFMDEPTSGLDARAASIVMRTVRNTVDTGRTVVCTIHQPSIDIFDAFDELFLLKRGGEEIYVGPLGRHSSHLIKYFEGIEGVSKIKDGYNPATWMLEVTASAQEMALGIDFTEVYKNSELYRRNKGLISELSTPKPEAKELYFPTKFSQPFHIQCMACFWKQYWSYWRNPSYTAVRFVSTTFIAFVFGSIFWNLGSKRSNQQDIFNSFGSMYSAVLFLGIQNAVLVQPVVAVERTVFYRERSAGMYSAMPYAFAQVAIEFPYILAQTLVYGTIVYAMIGFQWTAAKFFWYIFIMYFTLLYFTFYGMMTVAVSPNHHIASIIAAAFFGLWNLFSGFIIPHTRMPIWWRWYYWQSPVAWSLYGLGASQFGDIEDSINTNQTVKEFMKSYFGFSYDYLGAVSGVVVAFTVVFIFIFAFSIKVFNFQRR